MVAGSRRDTIPLSGVCVFLFPSYFFLSARADHPFCAAVFCSPRLGRRGFAFPCFALPRRHCSTASTALGRQPKCVADQFLGRFLSLLYLPALLLGRVGRSVCPDWYGAWRDSRLARVSADPLGKPTRRTFLHSEPLACSYRHAGNRSTFYLRLVARHAFRQHRSRRSTLADHGFRNAALPRSRCRIDRLLSRVLHWSAPATHAPRTTTVQLMRTRA
jgi:hypothetical protein